MEQLAEHEQMETGASEAGFQSQIMKCSLMVGRRLHNVGSTVKAVTYLPVPFLTFTFL
jgi:hypothetical protein